MVLSKLCLQRENACLTSKVAAKMCVYPTGIYWVYLVKPTNCNILTQERQPQMDMVNEQG